MINSFKPFTIDDSPFTKYINYEVLTPPQPAGTNGI